MNRGRIAGSRPPTTVGSLLARSDYWGAPDKTHCLIMSIT